MNNSICDYLLNSADRLPVKTALITQNMSVSYKDLMDQSIKLANILTDEGLSRGDRVVIACGNTLETVITFWAALLANAVVSVIDHKQPIEKIHYTLKDSDASAFIYTSNLDSKEIHKNFPEIILLGEKNLLKQISKHTDSTIPLRKHLDIDLASIIYTSGSTGEPKGVMHTHRSMLAASHSINTYLNNSSNDIVLSALPLSFDYGLYQMIMMVAVGGTLILEKDFVLPSRFLKLIETHQPTALPVVPSMVPLLEQFNTLKSYNLDSVRYVTNTGAALMQGHISTIQKLFKKSVVFSMYGVTECKRCTYLPPKEISTKPESIGIPIPNTEMWITDETGARLGPHEIGEIVVRGQTVMKGYWNKPEATARKLKAGPIPGEFILHTGDYGHIDEDGYFYFYGRVDEVIKSRGVKVSPKEIESILNANPEIIEAAAVGVAHDLYGQAIVLFVSASNKNLSIREVEQYCKRRLQPQQQPIDIVVMSSLPKTINGKLNKRLLSEDYQLNKAKSA